MIRAWLELLAAGWNLVVARARGVLHPCPPHDVREPFSFCRKCGAFPTDGDPG